MKRNVLLKYLKENGCLLDREGKKHSIYMNIQTGDWTAIPRHPDIREKTVMKICKELGVNILK
ncbi:MAG: type II toxin-antitoxin system HicA family toxin [Bacteroidales bacterium]|nr:type II toxin-antitoxin system HicA family toxin [Bacteroidales bacterium]